MDTIGNEIEINRTNPDSKLHQKKLYHNQQENQQQNNQLRLPQQYQQQQQPRFVQEENRYFGQYELIKLLGEGSFGDVWETFHSDNRVFFKDTLAKKNFITFKYNTRV